MPKISTVKQLCETIWDLEKELDLLDFEVQGVKVWQALRMEIYYELAQKLEILAPPHLTKKSKGYCRLIRNSLFRNPFAGIGKKDILIFDHPRKSLVDGQHIDIYTHDLIEELQNSGKSFEVYERPSTYKSQTKPEKYRKDLDFIRLTLMILTPLIKCSFSDNEGKQISFIENKIGETTGLRCELKNRFRRYVKRFKIQYLIYKKLFSTKKPDSIYVVVGYVLAPIIKAAKDSGIEVIEVQHGVFSDYHLGYSYPDTKANSLKYFPDKFLVWDSFWKHMCHLPLSPDRLGIRKFSYLEKRGGKYKHTPKRPNQILIISQGVIGQNLSEIIHNNASGLSGYNIVYKLHPGEYGRWREYPSLVELAKLDNVTIVDHNEKPLYEFMAESKYVIGVFSTALFEALNFGCFLLLLDLPGIEYMRRLIVSGKASLIQDSENILLSLETVLTQYDAGKDRTSQ